MSDLLGVLRIKDRDGNWVSVPGLKGDTGEPFKPLGIFTTFAALEAVVTDPEVGDIYLVGTPGAYDIYIYQVNGWYNVGRFMPKGDQGDPAPQSAITSAVETWLAANVDPETGYVLDRTLTQENAAAPADLVGDLKESLSNQIDITFFHKRIIDQGEYSQGSIKADGSIDSTVLNRITTKNYIPVISGATIENVLHKGYVVSMSFWDESKSNLGASQTFFLNTINKVVIPENAKFMRIQLRRSSSADLTPEESINCVWFYSINEPTWYDDMRLNFGTRLFTLAHRGLAGFFPENTIAAFVGAGMAGSLAIESDVQKTSDGVWVMLHDNTIDRVTNGTGDVRQMTFAEVQEYVIDIGGINGNASTYSDLKIPTLSDFLNICKKYGMFPFIEFKTQTFENNTNNITECIDYIVGQGFSLNQFAVVSTSLNIIKTVKEYDPRIICSYAMQTQPTAQEIYDLTPYKPLSLGVPVASLTDEIKEALNLTKLPLNYGISTVNDFYSAINLGVELSALSSWNLVIGKRKTGECISVYVADGNENIEIDLSDKINILRDIVEVSGVIKADSEVIASLNGVNGSADYGTMPIPTNWTEFYYYCVPNNANRRTFKLSGTNLQHKRITINIYKNCF